MDDGTWHALAQAQHGLASRAQLREHGGHDVTAEQLRWRLGRTWTLVLPRVVDLRGARQGPVVAREPAAVLARIERTYTRLVESGHRRADVVMTPRGPGLKR